MPLFYVPARSSRHRRACFALYRALIRQSQRVPLPAELSTTSPLGGTTNPITNLIRHGFRRNKRDTSPRLVVSALKNGYRYLTLFARAAADPASAEHASILAFLRHNEARLRTMREKRAAEDATRISTAPIPGRTPLITRISPPGAMPPVYVPTGPPRPLESFKSGVRKPPTLAAVSGVPFLRMKKPQPRFLERVLRQTAERRYKKIVWMLDMQGEGLEEARDEDRWDRMVASLLKREGMKEGKGEGKKGKRVGQKDSDAPTYAQSLVDLLKVMSREADEQRQDLVARGHAMWQIVLAEQEMALQEERERLVKEGKDPSEAKLRVWRRPVWARPKKGRAAPKKETQAAEPAPPSQE